MAYGSLSPKDKYSQCSPPHTYVMKCYYILVKFVIP